MTPVIPRIPLLWVSISGNTEDKRISMRELAELIGARKCSIFNWEVRGKMPWSKKHIRMLEETVPGVDRYLRELADTWDSYQKVPKNLSSFSRNK